MLAAGVLLTLAAVVASYLYFMRTRADEATDGQ